MMRRALVASVCSLLVLGGCDKRSGSAKPVEPSPAAADFDPVDEAATLLVSTLQRGAYEELASHTSNPLTHDLSQAEFDDLAAIVQWLGVLESRSMPEHDPDYAGRVRSYTLQFERGASVELEVSLDATGRLIGFEFSGKGYTEAERGVLSEPWREFKVYDFHLLDAEGNPLPKGDPVAGTRVEYEIVVGGIEALLGAHHLSVEKIVLDGSGAEVFKEPIEFDTTFDEDAMGIPRGVVRGYVEVPGPGSWTMDLLITDENAHRDIEYKHAFKTK